MKLADFLSPARPIVPLGCTSLAEAREKEPQIDERARNEEELAELLPLAEKLEGITRNPHPWIQAYFHGERAVRFSQEKGRHGT